MWYNSVVQATYAQVLQERMDNDDNGGNNKLKNDFNGKNNDVYGTAVIMRNVAASRQYEYEQGQVLLQICGEP